jgi:AraC-like DNA-binding protein
MGNLPAKRMADKAGFESRSQLALAFLMNLE